MGANADYLIPNALPTVSGRLSESNITMMISVVNAQ